MNKTSKILVSLVPLTLLVVVLFYLWRGLFIQPEILPSALVGKPAPAFHLTNLLSPSYPFTEQNFKGHVTLLNIWATWCSACEMEHPMLMDIKKKYNIPLYGILYKDNPKEAELYLSEMGNPYTILGNDNSGDTAIDYGVYGTPETFIIDKKGIIVYRHVGIINWRVWNEKMLPIIQKIS